MIKKFAARDEGEYTCRDEEGKIVKKILLMLKGWSLFKFDMYIAK